MVEHRQAPTFRDAKIPNAVYHPHQQIQSSNGLCRKHSEKDQTYIASPAQTGRLVVQKIDQKQKT